MSFRKTNQTYLEPAAQGIMIFGIIALCQPWIEVLHRFGLTITIFGLVAFMITTKIPRAPVTEEGDRP